MADYKHLRAAIDKKLSTDPEFRTIVKRINSGRATLIDTERYAQITAHAVSKELSGSVLDLADREAVTAQVLRDSYDSINEVCTRVQKAMDEKAGIHIRPQQAAFPGERVVQFAHSLVDPTVEDKVIKRRARAGSDTITKSFHDDYIRKNATFRNDAGLTCYIIREGSNCCDWCTKVAGKYRFGEQPSDIFRRHDNCDCTIIYDGQVLRGKQNADGSRSKTWEELPNASADYTPAVLSEADARAVEQRNLQRLRGLTNGENSGKIRISGAVSGALNPDSERADKHAEQYYESVRKMTTDVKRISENTGYSEDTIQSIKDYVFNEKHDLGDRYDYFDPDYKMAQTWQRLIDGKNILPHDLTLIKHEEMEKDLMNKGFTQSEAHTITSRKYNYDKEAREYYDKINGNSKK